MSELVPRSVRILLVVAVLFVIAGLAAWRQFTTDDTPDVSGPAVLTGATTSTDATSVEVPDDAVDLRGQASVEIIVVDNEFDPPVVVITPGTEVTWLNTGRNEHNVFADDGEAFEPVPTSDLAPDTSATRSIDTLGEIAYYCSIHGAPGVGQTGTMLVA